MTRVLRRLVLPLLFVASAVPAFAQSPGAFTTIQITGTTNSALTIGCALGTTTGCTGGVNVGLITANVDALINGVTVGTGSGNFGANTAVGRSVLSAYTGVASIHGNSGFGDHALFNLTTGAEASCFGYYACYTSTGGNALTAFGYQALYSATSSHASAVVGFKAGYSTTTGNEIVAVGLRALYSNVIGHNSVAVGSEAGYLSTQGGAIFLGFNAGRYETGGNVLYIDDQDRTNTAGDKAGAIIYGMFNPNPALQQMTINANLIVDSTAVGGAMGRGTINVATGLYLNGVAYANPHEFAALAARVGQLEAQIAQIKGGR